MNTVAAAAPEPESVIQGSVDPIAMATPQVTRWNANRSPEEVGRGSSAGPTPTTLPDARRCGVPGGAVSPGAG